MSDRDRLREDWELAVRGLERIKTSDLTMDGFTTYHGRLSMDETVAINNVLAAARSWLEFPTEAQVEAATHAFINAAMAVDGPLQGLMLAESELKRIWLAMPAALLAVKESSDETA